MDFIRGMPELLADELAHLMATHPDGPLKAEDLWERIRSKGHELPLTTIQGYFKASNYGMVPKAHALEALAAGLDTSPDVFYEWPIAKAQAERGARATAIRAAKATAAKAAARPRGTRTTSPSTRPAQGGEGGGAGR